MLALIEIGITGEEEIPADVTRTSKGLMMHLSQNASGEISEESAAHIEELDFPDESARDLCRKMVSMIS